MADGHDGSLSSAVAVVARNRTPRSPERPRPPSRADRRDNGGYSHRQRDCICATSSLYRLGGDDTSQRTPTPIRSVTNRNTPPVAGVPHCRVMESYESHVSSVDEDVISIHSPHSFIRIGDYNLPNIVWSSDNLGLVVTRVSSPSLSLIVDSFSLHNHLFQCNHIRNSSGGLLDLVFSSSNEVTASSATSPLVPADLYHPPLAICFPLSKLTKKPNSISYYDFKNANSEAIKKFFLSSNWKDTFSLYSANDSATFFNDALLHCINSFVPLKIYITSSFPRWVTKELKNTHLAHSPRYFWKYFRDLYSQTSIPSNVQYGSLTASSDLESASFFSEYFASVYKPVTSSSSPVLQFEHPYSLPSNCHFSPDDVLSSLDKLKSVSSNGPDGIGLITVTPFLQHSMQLLPLVSGS
ncbi:hypothetical protein ACI65C_005947 [Semiaphis heraclei]